MAERNWGAITSGAAFQSLVTTLLFFEDPKAALFGRPGRDGGQDARSGDGTTVFQAKHHMRGTAVDAIRDAKKEAETIREYRKPEHPRHTQWAGVTHWRLVTNVPFNPTNRQTWDTDIVPLFAELGLRADYWDQATLDALLDKHPEIDRSYFKNEKRIFLSIPEIAELLPGQEPFLHRNELGPFCGRAEERAAIREFLASEKLFLVVHGAGGTGKTRLIVEAGNEIAGEGEWQVLWAHVESMADTGTWFEAIVPERATLLLVDEPSDERLLKQLAEQLGGRVGRTAKWKVVVAVRSPKAPVLRFLGSARMKQRVHELALAPLPSADAEEMCFSLLTTGKQAHLPEEAKRSAARQLSQRFARHPVWLTLAIQHLEDHGDLSRVPTDAETLADEYLREIEESLPEVAPETVCALLRWVALIGPVNRQDNTAIKLIGERCGLASLEEVRARLAELVRRRALAERGAYNRFIELKPDVLRDHVLLRWLATDIGQPHPTVSAEGRALLQTVLEAASSGSVSDLGRAILVSLAHTEFILRLAGHEFGLLGGFFESLESAVSKMSASQRVALAETLESISQFHPRAMASLMGVLRRSSVPDETVEGLFGDRLVTQTDVILALAWPLFGAAMGAQSSDEKEVVLRELCALTEAEAELAAAGALPNDGKRAAALVTRVLEGGPQFWSEYDDTAQQLATELLDTLTKQPPSRGQLALLQALVQPLLQTERRQVWADDHTFAFRTFAIVPGSAAWSAREAIITQLKKILRADAIPPASRVQLWRVFADVQDGLESLRWTHEVLASRSPSIEELTAAREVWDWHRHHERDPEIKEAAEALETLYAGNALAKEFQPLLPTLEERTESETCVVEKAASLALATNADEISAFIDRAVTFLGTDQELGRLDRVAWSLGTHAESHRVVEAYIEGALKPPTVDPRAEFAVIAAMSWLAALRVAVPERAHLLVRKLLEQCGSDARRAHLLERIYGRAPRLRDMGDASIQERALLRGSRDLFMSTGRHVAFVAALAVSAGDDWSTLQPLLEDALDSVPAEQLPRAIQALVGALYWAVREAPQPPTELAEWLMSQVLRLPDLGDLGGSGKWRLDEILKRVGPLDVRWLPEALRRRQEQESASGAGMRSRTVGYSARLGKYVRQIEAAHAADAEILAAVSKVLDFVQDSGTIVYHVPEILHDVDPEGLVVPGAVAERIRAAENADDLRRLARIGGAYAINSVPWRMIALAAIRAATPFGENALRSVHISLGSGGIFSWSGTHGEVPPVFLAAVAEARAALDAEQQVELRPYWKQRLDLAEAELRHEQERAKEERGE